MEWLGRWLAEPEVWIGVNSLITAATAFICGRFLRDAAEATDTITKVLPPNDDKSAEIWFLKMLSRTRREVVMYDDGDPDTLYDSKAVVCAIKEKMQKLDDFEVRCMLTECTGKTRFEQAFAHEDRVKIYARNGARDSTHYKLFDNREAYVSHHARGEKARRRFVLHCRKPARQGKHPLALRRYYKDFDNHASAA